MSSHTERLLDHAEAECESLRDEVKGLTVLLADIRKDLDMRAENSDWAKVEDPEFFYSTLGHTEGDGFVVALGSTNYLRLCEVVDKGGRDGEF